MGGTLFLVATPIGNLEDITGRALSTLREVSFVVCEDTRYSRGLLTHFGIQKPLISLPAFAEGQRAGAILDRVDGGDSCALITDAGSPAISDPGEALVAEALARGIRVIPIPGPTALVAALSASGLPSARFHFLGFLPRTGAERKSLLEELAPLSATIICYESPHRVLATLEDFQGAFGDRRAVVARELTKLHEEFVRGSLGELIVRYRSEEVRGEVVLLVEGRRVLKWLEADVLKAVSEGMARGDKLKPLSTEIAKLAGWSGADVYRLGIGLKRGDD